MGYLAFMALSIVLFASFLFLTRREAEKGARLFASSREALDVRVERLMFVLTHVDFESFVREQIRVIGAHVVHDVAHLSLIVVRSAEKLLSRVVKHLRARHGIETATSAAPRAFVKTMSEFKQHLSSTRPPIPEL